jgi:hypothetical protein
VIKVRDVNEGCVLRTAAGSAEEMLVVSQFSNYCHRVLFAKALRIQVCNPFILSCVLCGEPK